MKTTPANDRFLRALRREPVDATPVWIMRQAGRYLPEYRATRARAGSFLALAKTPDLACEVTLQPLARFDLDAAILFSDILTIPDAMGLGLSFAEGEGPRFEHPMRTRAEIMKLAPPDPEGELRYVMDAVRTIKGALANRLPLIGFSGSPWTLACYMIEGRGGTDFARAKALMLDDPQTMHALLEVNARAVRDYLRAQAAAGADALMIFDTWGGVLAPHHFREFSQRWIAWIAAELRVDVPLIAFSKGVGALEELAGIGADALGLDWTVDIGDARRRVGERVALQGNLDPATLHGSVESIRREAGRVLERYGRGPGHVFNLGHGITPDVEPDKLGALVDAVRELSRPYHA